MRLRSYAAGTVVVVVVAVGLPWLAHPKRPQRWGDDFGGRRRSYTFVSFRSERGEYVHTG
jgi:hypothetical protein